MSAEAEHRLFPDDRDSIGKALDRQASEGTLEHVRQEWAKVAEQYTAIHREARDQVLDKIGELEPMQVGLAVLKVMADAATYAAVDKRMPAKVREAEGRVRAYLPLLIGPERGLFHFEDEMKKTLNEFRRMVGAPVERVWSVPPLQSRSAADENRNGG